MQLDQCILSKINLSSGQQQAILLLFLGVNQARAFHTLLSSVRSFLLPDVAVSQEST